MYRGFFCALIFTFFLMGGRAKAQDLSLYATGAAMMDGSNGRLLYGKQEDVPLANASTTKIVTAILVLELGDEDAYVTISKAAASAPRVKLYLKMGEQVKVKDLLYSMLLESHNDSAVALGEYLEQISGKELKKVFEEKLEELGCENTVFLTPNGLDATLEDGTWHHTTASDLCTIMRYCVCQSNQRERFLKITQTSSYRMERKGKVLTNKNAFLSMEQGVLSGKTGFTNQAGYCYVCAVQKENGIFLIALLGSGWPGHKSYKWKDAKTLLAYGVKQYREVALSDYLVEDGFLVEVPIKDGMANVVPATLQRTDSQDEKRFLLAQDETVDVNILLDKEAHAPIQKEQILGKIEYKTGTFLHTTEYLYAREAVAAQSFMEFVKIVLQNFLKKMQFALCELLFL